MRPHGSSRAARATPIRSSQIYPWSEGALYQVYGAPGQITNIALERGSGVTRRVHVLVKPTRPDLSTNLVITTDRRIYMIELRSGERPYMPAVA